MKYTSPLFVLVGLPLLVLVLVLSLPYFALVLTGIVKPQN